MLHTTTVDGLKHRTTGHRLRGLRGQEAPISQSLFIRGLLFLSEKSMDSVKSTDDEIQHSFSNCLVNNDLLSTGFDFLEGTEGPFNCNLGCFLFSSSLDFISMLQCCTFYCRLRSCFGNSYITSTSISDSFSLKV